VNGRYKAGNNRLCTEIKRREDISIFPHCHFKVKQIPCDVSYRNLKFSNPQEVSTTTST
jgi:hypothetical protein